MEKLEDIAGKIKVHCEKEIDKKISNRAYGRYSVKFGDEDRIFWLTNLPNYGGYKETLDVQGNVVGTIDGPETTLKEDGDPIFKNSPLGELLITRNSGKHLYTSPSGKKEIEFYNSSKYLPVREALAEEIIIQTGGNTYSFQTLKKWLDELAGIKTAIEELENEQRKATSETERQSLLKQITDKEFRLKQKLEQAQKFIRASAELRYQPILDPTQELVKRSEIFEQPIIINGGPGTGKSTTLIQRIRFLLDLSGNDRLSDNDRKHYIEHLTDQKKTLMNGNISWVFFSPNLLLKLFLQNAMGKEGLDTSSNRLKVWEEHKLELGMTYRLLNPETQRPFLRYKQKPGEDYLLPIDHIRLQKTIRTFRNFIVNYSHYKLRRITKLNVNQFSWKNTGISIQKFITRSLSSSKAIDELLRLYINLNENYRKEAQDVSDEYNAMINSLTIRWSQTIMRNEELRESINNILKQKDIESEDEDALESEDFDEKQNHSDWELKLFNQVKSILRKMALARFDTDVKITATEKEIIGLIPDLRDQIEYDKIGQLAFFKKYFEKVTKGIDSNLLREIPVMYKKYRKANIVLTNVYEPFVLDIISKDQNKRLHNDEIAFLIYIINTSLNRLELLFPSTYERINHPYVEAHKFFKRNIIAVDEATDFHLIDLLCMSSLCDTHLSSFTIAGDLMQRMTSHGLYDWQSLEKLLPEKSFSQTDLKISYRQSPTLLRLGNELYKLDTGVEGGFTPFLQTNENEPKPLQISSRDEREKINWMVDRIFEIYKAYGSTIPSIAIFTKDDISATKLETEFEDFERLTDVGIVVKACNKGEVLGNPNTVRIFAVPYIKGLEFEAVFFHNIDELDSSKELIAKYIYVGLSRATFYLGITSSGDFSGREKPIIDKFFSSTENWAI